jgi:SMI1 / KNR4 family (SUKH-1)
MAGVTAAELDAAELELGVRLPADYREFLQVRDGLQEYGERSYLEVLPLAAMLTVNEDALETEREVCPGFVIFGTDGARERIGWDFRSDPPPVVLVDITTENWDGALHQAPDFTTFLAQFRAEGTYRWT